MNPSVSVRKNILEVSGSYQGILSDAYGVYWDGTNMIQGALEAFENLMTSGKVVGILSNSSQSAAKEIEKYKKCGLNQGHHYHFLLTSGEIARVIFEQKQAGLAREGAKYYVFCDAHPKFGSPHHAIFKTCGLEQTPQLDEADFIYAGIPHLLGEDQSEAELFRNSVEELAKSKKLLVCTNPDLFAQGSRPDHFVVRQGSIAELYKQSGGQVFYIGKPDALVYRYTMGCFNSYGVLSPQQVLMVGDTPQTDIQGANNFNMDSALVTATGVAGSQIAWQGLESFLSSLAQEQHPTYLIERFGL